MNRTKTAVVSNTSDLQAASLKDWITLTKPEITFLVTISALAGFVLASPSSIDGWKLFWALIGIPLTSAGGCALNMYIERDIDALMKRTASRPIPAGRIKPAHARRFGAILTGVGVAILCPLTNPLTGVMAALTVALYIWVYTPLKQKTTWNTLVGTIPGALPILGGWTAATGTFGWGGWVLFGVLVCWQMPHFFSLAWMYRKDYDKGQFMMLPSSDETGKVTASQTLWFSIAMIAFSVAPVFLGLSGLIYLSGAVLLGIWFMIPVGRFYMIRSAAHARSVLKASVMYIPLLLAAIIVDRFLG